MKPEKSAEEIDRIQEAEAKLPEATFADFFESKPANVAFRITDATLRDASTRGSRGSLIVETKTAQFSIPTIRLWCSSDDCDGIRIFDPHHKNETLYVSESDDDSRDWFITFTCRNCHRSTKKYAFSYRYNQGNTGLIALKLGEDPPLSRHIPSRLRKLVETDRENFNKGLRSEAHGLGVGAFAYYRQLVENLKDRLIDGIRKVAELNNPLPELIKELEEAKQENRFSFAVEKIKHAIPEILRIHGLNPLTLLHKALSEGLHAGTDEECLQISQDIRVILSEFSERLDTALKDDQELKKAVSGILNRPKKSK
jgi:hypothetical protein